MMSPEGIRLEPSLWTQGHLQAELHRQELQWPPSHSDLRKMMSDGVVTSPPLAPLKCLSRGHTINLLRLILAPIPWGSVLPRRLAFRVVPRPAPWLLSSQPFLSCLEFAGREDNMLSSALMCPG